MDGDARLHGSFVVELWNPKVDKQALREFQAVTYVSKKCFVASTARTFSQSKVSIFGASANQIKP